MYGHYNSEKQPLYLVVCSFVERTQQADVYSELVLMTFYTGHGGPRQNGVEEVKGMRSPLTLYPSNSPAGSFRLTSFQQRSSSNKIKSSSLLQSCLCQSIATIKRRREKSPITLTGVFLFHYLTLKAVFIFFPTEWSDDCLL